MEWDGIWMGRDGMEWNGDIEKFVIEYMSSHAFYQVVFDWTIDLC